MSDVPKRSLTSSPAISPSLIPSDVPDINLPFGPPPAELVEMETATSGIPKEQRRRIRTLADNANRVRPRSLLNAAICWHEAGRLLSRAGREAEAWVCYSRALVIFPDYKPALSALRRLARRAGATDVLVRLLEAHIDRTTQPAEIAALHSEYAVTELRRGRPGVPMDALREACDAWPEALVPNLLKVGVSVRQGDEEELVDTLTILADRWPEPTVAQELHLIVALLEERLGRLDTALERLDTQASEATLSAAGKWARVRLCLRLDRPEEATKCVDELLEEIDSPVIRSALKRQAAAVNSLVSNDHSEEIDVGAMSTRGDDASDPVWDLAFLAAARTENRARAAVAADRLAQTAVSPSLKEALAVSAILNRWTLGATPDRLDEAINPDSAVGRALVSFLALAPTENETEREQSGGPSPVSVELQEALGGRDWSAVSRVLSSLRERSADERDRWALAVAEAAVFIEHLDRPNDALDMLRGETDRLNRPPLPALLRACDSRGESLAELAVSEAEDADNDEFKAWRFAWAGHHVESTDPHEAGRLFLRALELQPLLPLAIAGLGRTVSDRGVLAEAYINAAEVATEREERVQYLLLAAVYYLAQGAGSRATELFGEALELEPSDVTLHSTVLRLALSHQEAALPEYVQPVSDEPEISSGDLVAFGSLALELDPRMAVQWFQRAVDASGDDPIATVGLREALLRAGRGANVSEPLSARANDADSPIEAAEALARLAHVYRYHEDAPDAARRSLLELKEKLPGHRSTLIRLLIDAFANHGHGELPQLFESLAGTVADDDEAAALSSAAWRAAPTDLEGLRRVVERDSSALVEAARLEGITDDPAVRRAMLERLTEGTSKAAIHLSRLAGVHGELNDAEQALQFVSQARALRPHSIFDLHTAALYQRELGRYADLADTLEEVASNTPVDEYAVENLLAAAEIAHGKLEDRRRAARLYLAVVARDPENETAYRMSRELLDAAPGDAEETTREESSDETRRISISLLEARLKGISDPDEQRTLHLELARMLIKDGDDDERDRAKEHIARALEISPDDLASHRLIAEVHRDDEEWNDAIGHLVAAAHLAVEPDAGIEVFFTLGELYMDHTEHDDLAEKSFLKVLGWDRSHFQAMERLSDLYLRIGNHGRAAQALEHLIRLTEDPTKKVRKIVALARVLEEYLGRVKDAEKILGEARQLDPLAWEPVEALAKIFDRQGDNLALNIHLDAAMASQASLLIAEPERADVYSHIHRTLSMKREHSLASIAVEAMKLAGVPPSELPTAVGEARWEVGARVGDPIFDEYICPKAIPAGLREVMKAVEESLARVEGVSAKQVAGAQGKRLDRRCLLATTLSELASGFGVESLMAFVDSGPTIRIAPGSPATVVFPQVVADTDDTATVRFAVNYALEMIRLGLALATVLPETRLRSLVGAAVRLSIRDFSPTGIKAAAIEADVAKLREALPGRIVDQIRPFAFDCTDALGRATLGAELRDIGNRAGFVGAGSLTGAVTALRQINRTLTGPISKLPGVGAMMAFVFSRDHIELRTRMGI